MIAHNPMIGRAWSHTYPSGGHAIGRLRPSPRPGGWRYYIWNSTYMRTLSGYPLLRLVPSARLCRGGCDRPAFGWRRLAAIVLRARAISAIVRTTTMVELEPEPRPGTLRVARPNLRRSTGRPSELWCPAFCRTTKRPERRSQHDRSAPSQARGFSRR